MQYVRNQVYKLIIAINAIFMQMEAKMILARLIQAFKLTFPPDYKLVPVERTTLQPNDSVPCTLDPAGRML